jgi:acyl dehydratase
VSFAVDRIGTWTPELEFAVDPARTTAYAAATNDPIAAHRAGELAPPVFAIVPVWEPFLDSIALVTPPEVLSTVLHLEQDMVFHAPIVPGTVVAARCAPVGVHGRRSGTTVVCRCETRDRDSGRLLNEQHAVIFFRAGGDGSHGESAPPHRLPAAVTEREPVATVDQTFDADQTLRYSEASGDLVPIHLDEEAARAVGLPGIIIHGMCTMAHNSWAAVCELAGGDSTRLRRLAVRFSRPVRPGDTITTRFYAVDADAAGARPAGFPYECRTSDGETVVKDGWVEVTP